MKKKSLVFSLIVFVFGISSLSIMTGYKSKAMEDEKPVEVVTIGQMPSTTAVATTIAPTTQAETTTVEPTTEKVTKKRKKKKKAAETKKVKKNKETYRSNSNNYQNKNYNNNYNQAPKKRTPVQKKKKSEKWMQIVD